MVKPWANVIKNLSIIHEFLKPARVFVRGKIFEPSLMFLGKAGASILD